jgi:hypothetical protein
MELKLKKEFENQCEFKIGNYKNQIEVAKDIGISINTLRRFLGKEKSKTQLTTNSLNLISNYIGYNDFNSFKNKDQNNSSIDFITLKTFYDTVKNKGIIMNETRFQNVNYQFAKQIITDENNLKHFFLHFNDNKEALEYVLGWHPTYSKITQNDYQKLLFKFENKLKLSHIKVFVNSFVFFGKFISNNLTESDFDLIKKAEKEVIKMRKEYDFFWAFPEVRFAIAKTLFLFHTKNTHLEDYVNEVIEINKTKAELHNQIIFDLYYADALNLIGKYHEADNLQTKYKKTDEIVQQNYYHYQTQQPFFMVSRALTCIKTENYFEAKNIIEELRKLNFSKLSFDNKEYIEIQFYIISHLLNQKNTKFQKKVTEINSKISFYYLQNYL